MNQRIRELAEQAGFYYTDKTGFITPAGCNPAKFAELIVAECLGIVDDAERGGSNDIWDNAVKFIRRDLQEHFGVEE
jgi:hypothetical protein